MSRPPEKPYRIVFFGTSDFAVPILERLHHDGGFSVLEAVTQPDRPAGRKRLLTAPDVKRAALSLGIKVHQPESLRDEAAISHFKALQADAYVVVSYGKILPGKLLDIPRFGGVNVHASLLPRYRGASPINAAIAAGEKETGNSIMRMDAKMDEGPILAVQRLPIDDEDTTASLAAKLSRAASMLIGPTLKGYFEGTLVPEPQDPSKATVCGILTREDGRIDWSRSAVEIERLVRAMQPWPEAFTRWARGGKTPLKLTIKKATVLHPVSRCGNPERPGTVCKLSDGTVGVNCGEGSLILKTVQLEGKNASDLKSFLNGYPDFANAELD